MVTGDDGGLCSAEPPADGAAPSCGSGSAQQPETPPKKKGAETYEYVEKEMTEEEKEVWERRFYTKLVYTNDIDWKIRHKLDYADDHIVEVS